MCKRIVCGAKLNTSHYRYSCVRGYSDNEKDCPVCRAKNVQVKDALRAQSESRGQYDAFHDLLDRSMEPFSVVAEYFGRGLFNQLVIVEEDGGEANNDVCNFDDVSRNFFPFFM